MKIVALVSLTTLALLPAMILVDGERSARGDTKATPTPASEAFAAKVSEAYAVKVTIKDLDAGVPGVLVKPIEHRFGKDKDKYLAQWKANETAFEKAWDVYSKRGAEVTAAIAKAAELQKNKKDDDAKKALLAVITVNKFDEDGKVDVDKLAFLEPRDAEIAAVVELGKLMSAQKDFVGAASIPPLMHGRRHVGDKDDERYLWLASERRKDMKELAFIQKKPANDGFEMLLERADRAGMERRSTGRTMLKAFPTLGAKYIELFDAKAAVKGDWVFFRVEPTKIDDKTLTFADHGTYQVPINCRDGDKVIGWNEFNHTPIWNTKCDYKDVTENIDLKVTFAKAPPAWAKSSDSSIWVVGKVAQPGSKWTITDAGIADWRFLGLLGL